MIIIRWHQGHWTNTEEFGWIIHTHPIICKTKSINESLYNKAASTHDAIITSSLRLNNVATSFWRYNDIIITSCTHWEDILIIANNVLLISDIFRIALRSIECKHDVQRYQFIYQSVNTNASWTILYCCQDICGVAFKLRQQGSFIYQ